MKTIISCPVLPHRTTQSSCHIPKQRGVTVRSFTECTMANCKEKQISIPCMLNF